MQLKGLSSKNVLELDHQTFMRQYCKNCRFEEFCAKYDRNLKNCKSFVNEGVFDKFFRKKGLTT